LNPWRPFPLLRLLFPFVGGIIVAIWLNPATVVPFWAFASGTTLLFLINVFSVSPGYYKIRWILGLFINITVFLFGFELTRLSVVSNSSDNIGYDKEGWAIAEVIDPVSVKGATAKTVISVRYFHKEGRWSPVIGKSLLNLKMKQASVPIQFGEFLLLYARFQEVVDNGNPYSFNYARYLKNRGILNMVWVDENAWKLLKIKTTNPLRKLAFKLRGRLLDLLRENQVKGNEFAVAAALLLGYVDELGTDLRNSYAATGVTHILSVSGMHVGIIFLFLEFILGFLNRSRLGRIMKIMIMLTFIWFYAFLTGLSPAVLRAAAMLSFLIIGKSLKRSPEIFNILAASLFFLLIYNPLLILDVGFQLSYLAVSGIVLLYQPIYNLIHNGNWMVDKIWSVMAMTLAAQLSTTPVSLFYFHQFPNYFLITNLFVVPFSSLIIYSGIVAVALGSVPIVSIISAKVLSCLVWSLNFFIQFMEKLPASTSRGLFLSFREMLLWYLVLGSVLIFFLMKRRYYFYIFLIGLVLINVSLLFRQISRLNVARITIYNIRNMSVYNFSVQDRSILWYDFKHLDHFQSQLERNIPTVENSWNGAGILKRRSLWLGDHKGVNLSNLLYKQMYRKGCFFQFREKRVGLLKEKIPKGLNKKISLDYLIISHDAKVSIKEVMNVFKTKTLIIDGMNSAFRTRIWLEEAKKLGVPCHTVSREGAFTEEI